MTSYWHGVLSDRGTSSDSGEHTKTDPTVPPGFYVCEVTDFGAWPSKEDPSWNVKWTLRILEGVQQGKNLVRWSAMTDEKASKNFDLFQNTLGELPDFDPDHGFGDLGAVRHKMSGAVVKVKAESWQTRQGEKRMIVYINQSVALGDAQDASAPTKTELQSEGDDDDRIPF